MFTNEWFHLVSDITLSITCNNQDKAVTATHINNTFQSNKWQVKFALRNAHLMGVTTTFPINQDLDGKILQPQEESRNILCFLRK